MGWPLFFRTATGEWQPIFGALSEFPGALVIYAAVLVAPGYLILRGLRQRRAGRACYTRVIAWAAAMWPVRAKARSSTRSGTQAERSIARGTRLCDDSALRMSL